ncbi:AMP-dependent synthetase/ligase [Chachezhania antarctica]|uniref:AMP-dependent synthetase/ligase n=1 Tax=Chachezhania antarctica TaxID=2340860 RepID=UPI000EAFE3E3|nr:AMP-binding protein [Chachezhania antarctica]|tara:strand:+ start:7217 stop:9016 length:1800 start_codon:yes stop_codon:yes gene_type:complete
MTDLPDLTLPAMLREQAETRPGDIAIRQKDFGIWQPTTWAAYYDRARDVAHGLRLMGLPANGHVAVLSENRIEWLLSQMGAGLSGAVTVGVYPTSPASEVGYVLEHSDSSIVICEDQEQVDKILEIRDGLPKLTAIVVMETKGMRAYPPGQVTSFAQLEADGHADRQTNPGLTEEVLKTQTADDIGLMIYTSGSTGKPKGAMLSYRNIRAQAVAFESHFGLTAADRYLSYLPLCHVAEQAFTVFGPSYTGAQVNFGESLRTVQEDLREVAPTVFLGVPRIWEKLQASIHIGMLEAGGYRKALYDRALKACDGFANVPPAKRSAGQKLAFRIWYWLVFRSLQNFVGLRKARVAMTGAAPISPMIVTYFRAIGVPLLEAYGATETSGVILAQTPDLQNPGSVGKPVVNAEVRLGEADELMIRSDLVFSGYYKNDAATENTIRDGWLHTGDVARVEDGQYHIVDRLKDIMITAGGKNLSPSEIENTMKSSPFIKECIVIGEKRKFVSALIQVDFDTTAKWAEEQGIAYTNFRNLSENPSVREMIEAEIARANATLASVAQIRKFHMLTKELDHDDGEVTATMKVRRASIAEKYASQIEALYG